MNCILIEREFGTNVCGKDVILAMRMTTVSGGIASATGNMIPIDSL